MSFTFTGYYLTDTNATEPQATSGMTGTWNISPTAKPSTITISDGRDAGELAGDNTDGTVGSDVPTDPTQTLDNKIVFYEIVGKYADENGNEYTAIVFDHDKDGSGVVDSGDAGEESYFIGFIKNSFDPQNVTAADLEAGPVPPAGSTMTYKGLVANTPALDIICFAEGTLIRTKDGYRPVEALQAGDMIWTLDSGYKPLKWIGSRALSASDLERAPNLSPITVAAGSLAPNSPAQDLTVSPQHRILINLADDKVIEDYSDVLCPAKSLLGKDGIAQAEEARDVVYHHFMFDKHEIVDANGTLTESLYTGKQALKSLPVASRNEIFELFPHLKDEDRAAAEPARPLMKTKHAEDMVNNHIPESRDLAKPASVFVN